MQGIVQFLEHHRVVAIGPGNAEHHGDAPAVRDEVTFATKFASVGGVWACAAPRGLGTRAPSVPNRLKFSLSAWRSSSSNAKCRLVPHICCLPVT